MIWCEPTNHENDCWFCMTTFSKPDFKCIKYAKYPASDLLSAKRPVEHSDSLPVPTPPKDNSMNSGNESKSDSDSDSSSSDMDYMPDIPSSVLKKKEPKLISQATLNDLVKNMELTKENAQILGNKIRMILS